MRRFGALARWVVVSVATLVSLFLMKRVLAYQTVGFLLSDQWIANTTWYYATCAMVASALPQRHGWHLLAAPAALLAGGLPIWVACVARVHTDWAPSSYKFWLAEDPAATYLDWSLVAVGVLLCLLVARQGALRGSLNASDHRSSPRG